MGKTINELKIGDKDYFEKTITETDVYLYAGITGDFNPAHINQVASEKTMFKGRIAHGMLTAGLISAVLGTKLPGPGTIYLGQELKFTKPVRIGDTIKAEVEVVEIIPEKNRVKLKTTCTNQNNEVVLEGVATVLAPKE
ncbi:MAG: MaoC family dehydratase [Thermoanaerobacter sp.]|nr:MaoC family dehydratase [Thermoanaerobacter sp.]